MVFSVDKQKHGRISGSTGLVVPVSQVFLPWKLYFCAVMSSNSLYALCTYDFLLDVFAVEDLHL
jgi:hypothetical protein